MVDGPGWQSLAGIDLLSALGPAALLNRILGAFAFSNEHLMGVRIATFKLLMGTTIKVFSRLFTLSAETTTQGRVFFCSHPLTRVEVDNKHCPRAIVLSCQSFP